MIRCEIKLDSDECNIYSAYFKHVPNVGDILWSRPHDPYVVVQVAHWISTEWSPTTHNGEPIHSVCLYVKAVES
jgi:hypothetical protein